MKREPLPRRSRSDNATGFSLIEVLISVLVLSVGLIGTAMVQLHAFRTTEQSSFHNTALALAMQIADEIRANTQQMQLTADNPFESFRYKVETAAPDEMPSPNCYKAACTPANWATHSMIEWRKRVFETLPGGRLEICRDAVVFDDASSDFRWCEGHLAGGADAPVVVKVSWLEKSQEGKPVGGAAPRVAILVSPFTQ